MGLVSGAKIGDYLMTETDIQNLIRIELSKRGVVLRLNVGNFTTQDGRHISSGLPNGTPDLLFLGPDNNVAFIEVKTPIGQVREDQKKFMARMNELGIKAGVARCVKDAISIVEG